MVINGCESGIEVQVIKSTIPIIWLDTSIISNIVKGRLNMCDPSKGDIYKCLELFDKIQKCIKSGSLICPIGDQMKELRLPRLENYDEFIKECVIVLKKLGKGDQFLSNIEIDNFQLSLMIHAYIKGVDTLDIEVKKFLTNDKLEVTDFIGKPFREKFKEKSLEEFEKKRQEKIADGITFHKELKMNFEGYAAIIEDPIYEENYEVRERNRS